MKILAFTDVHGNKHTAKQLVKKSGNADIMVCSGDISYFGGGVEVVLKELEKAKKTLLVINGNHEIEEPFKKLCKKFKYVVFMHKASYEIGDLVFFGFGGGGFSQREPEFEKSSKEFMKTVDKNKKVVVITHAPPFNTKLDYLGFAGHRGNASLIEFIDKYQPAISISGHFHETFGKMQYFRKTLMINPGPDGRIIQI